MPNTGPIARYYVARYSTSMLFSFEASVALAVFALLLVLRWTTRERALVWVFLVGTAIHTLLEGIAEGTGVRHTAHASLFGMAIRFPATSLVAGAFEGGVVVTVAYLFVKAVSGKDRLAGRLFTAFCLVFALTGIAGVFALQAQLEHDPGSVSFTRRAMFASHALILLAVFYALALGYFFLRKSVSSREKRSFLVYYLGIVLFTTVLALPLHVGLLRYIEVDTGGTFQVAATWEQVVIMYAFNLPLEAGWYVCTYPILHALGLASFPRGGSG